MATTYEIIQAIQQAASNAHDGALDDKGEPLKVGLKREEGHLVLDSRSMDGFGVSFHGNKLVIKYQSDVLMKDLQGKGFEGDIKGMVNKVASFLRKEYKKITGSALTLTKDGEVDILVQKTSNVRTWVQANAVYKIGGLKDVEEVESCSDDKLDDSIKKWLAIGKDKYPGAKKPSNMTAKNA